MKVAYSSADLLEKGQEMLAIGQPDVAIQFFQRGLAKEPNHGGLLEALGATYIDTGDIPAALLALKKAVHVSPEESGTAWMYLGQLQDAHEAVHSFTKGLELLRRDQKRAKEVEDGSSDGNSELLRDQLCAGYCAVAELYMTDLCLEADAEQKCEEMLEQARALRPENVQVLQALASFRISQCKPDEARPLVLRAANIISNAFQKQNSLAELAEVEELPPYEFRACTAKILLELSENSRAIGILQELAQEDDEIIETWVLLAQAHVELKEVSVKKRALGVGGNDGCFSLSLRMIVLNEGKISCRGWRLLIGTT